MDPRFHSSHPAPELTKALLGDHRQGWHPQGPPMPGGHMDKGFLGGPGFPNPLNLPSNLQLPILSTGQGFYTIESLEGVTSLPHMLPPQALMDHMDKSAGFMDRDFPGEGRSSKMSPDFNSNRAGGSPRQREMSPSRRHSQTRMRPLVHEPGFGGPRETGFGGPREAGFGGPREAGFGGPRESGFGGPREASFGGPRESGFGGPRDSGFGDPRDSGFGDPRESGLGGPREGGFGGPREGGFGGSREGGFGGPREGGFGGPREGGFGGPRDPSFGGPRESGFGGPHDPRFGGPRGAVGFPGSHEAGFPPVMVPHPGARSGWSRGGGEHEQGRGGRRSRDRDEFPTDRIKAERGELQKSKYGADAKKRRVDEVKPDNESRSSYPPLVDGKPRQGLGWCSVCKIDCKTPYVLEQHCAGKRHKKEVETLAEKEAGGGEGEGEEGKGGVGGTEQDPIKNLDGNLDTAIGQEETGKQPDAEAVVAEDINSKDELDDAFSKICDEMTGEVASVQNPGKKEEEIAVKTVEPEEKATSTPLVAKKRLKKVRDKPVKRTKANSKS